LPYFNFNLNLRVCFISFGQLSEPSVCPFNAESVAQKCMNNLVCKISFSFHFSLLFFRRFWDQVQLIIFITFYAFEMFCAVVILPLPVPKLKSSNWIWIQFGCQHCKWTEKRGIELTAYVMGSSLGAGHQDVFLGRRVTRTE